jgi:hypothetical protein
MGLLTDILLKVLTNYITKCHQKGHLGATKTVSNSNGRYLKNNGEGLSSLMYIFYVQDICP